MAQVLQSLTLTAMRGIKDLVLDGLAPFNLVVGANNAGKSTILEAAGIVLRPPDIGQWIETARHRDALMDIGEGICALFPNDGKSAANGDSYELSPIVLGATIQNEPRRVVTSALVSKVQDVSGNLEVNLRMQVSINGELPIEIRYPSKKPVSHEVPMHRVFTVAPADHCSTDFFVQMLSDVITMGQKKTALDFLKFFDSEVEELDIVSLGQRHSVYVQHARRGSVDLSSFGDGMRRSTALALALTRAAQGVLLVDEIEAGIHHTLLQSVIGRLWEVARTLNVQILSTTHSLEAIDAIVGALEENGATDALTAYWIQRKDGHHHARRYGFDRLKRMREGGLDIR